MATFSNFFSKMRLTIQRTDWRVAFKTALSASLSWIIGVALSDILQRPDTLVSGLWCVLSSIVVSQIYLGETYKAAWLRFLGILIGSIIGGFFATDLGSDPIILFIAIFFTVVLCSLLNNKEGYRIACLSVAVVLLFSGSRHDTDPWMFSLFRFIDSCIGIATTLAVAHLILPTKATISLSNNISNALMTLNKYYQIAVNFDVSKKDAEKYASELFAEIDNLFLENRNLLELAGMESLTKESPTGDWSIIVFSIEEIYESIQNLLHLEKEMLGKILDDPLASKTKDLIEQTTSVFKKLAEAGEIKLSPISEEVLKTPLDQLNAELMRFRETRRTRKFSLDDVEAFFVFYYSLRHISLQLERVIDSVLT